MRPIGPFDAGFGGGDGERAVIAYIFAFPGVMAPGAKSSRRRDQRLALNGWE